MNRLKCELCLKGCLPPLRVCEGGHLMCPTCSELIEDHCLSCQQPILTARQTLLNNVANKLFQLQALQQELAELLECPVCYRGVRPPLNLCINGHAVCRVCRPYLYTCPYCCDMFSDKSNPFLDNVIGELWMPCQYASEGCKTSGLLNVLASHETSCPDTPMPCRIRNCSWAGSRLRMARHVNEEHGMDILKEKSIAFCQNVLESWPNLSHTRLISAYGYLFWLHFYSKGNSLRFFVQLIGSQEESKLFMYKIDFYSPSLSGFKIKNGRQKYVQSCLETLTECTTMSSENLRKLVDNDDSLTYKVAISRDHKICSSIVKSILIAGICFEIYCGSCILIHFAKKLNAKHFSSIWLLLKPCAATLVREILSVNYKPWSVIVSPKPIV